MGSDIDQLDREILRALVKDVRASYKSIADRLGVSHNTVRARIDRMLDDNVFEFVVVTNPRKVGRKTGAYLLLDVEPTYQDEIARSVADRVEVLYSGFTIGSSDIICLVQVAGNEHLFRFVNGFVRQLPGVSRVHIHLLSGTIKALGGNDPRQFAMLDEE